MHGGRVLAHGGLRDGARGVPSAREPVQGGRVPADERLRRGERRRTSPSVAGVDCRTANLCVCGTCRALPTPEGTMCSPATAVPGRGQVHLGRVRAAGCGRPSPGVLAAARRSARGGAGRAGAARARGRALHLRVRRGCGVPARGLHGERAAALPGPLPGWRASHAADRVRWGRAGARARGPRALCAEQPGRAAVAGLAGGRSAPRAGAGSRRRAWGGWPSRRRARWWRS